MKKIGILTMYYNSINYGGTLQAYALQRYLENKGFESKQICFQKKGLGLKNSIKLHYKELGFFSTIFWGIDRIQKNISGKISNKIISKAEKKLYSERKQKFESFRNDIPHTIKVYNSNTISETNRDFDIFCCGSDQIWKPGVVCSEYMLGFVNKEKKKISYAASISKTNILKDDIANMIPYLNSFDKISVREEFDKDLLKKYLKNDVEWVVDPTLLLDKEDWEKLYIKNLVKEDYVFVYLLEANKKKYKIIEKFAKEKNLKIVTIPFASGTLNLNDRRFGDIHMTNAGPKEFITLIHDAKLVITDSFHATVFSNIFKTDFFVLERTEAPTMNSRIISLLKMFNRNEKFIEDKELENQNLGYKFNSENKYSKMKELSEKYLLSSIDK